MPLEALEAVVAIPELIVGAAELGSGNNKKGGGGGCLVLVIALVVIGGIAAIFAPKREPKPPRKPITVESVGYATREKASSFFDGWRKQKADKKAEEKAQKELLKSQKEVK